MDLTKLFELQYNLDTRIETQHKLENENLVDRKILALLVELGELANETRCFKFWSLKSPSEASVILEEYVDGIHFLLSLGIEFGYENKIFIKKCNQSGAVVDQFLAVYQEINYFHQQPTLENYEKLMTQYLFLGELLGFSFEQISEAYISKNVVNHVRQDQGY